MEKYLTRAVVCDTIIATDCKRREMMSRTTIYTLAEELNMTPSMISRALNPNGKISAEKRKIVLDAAKKHNFSPNKFASRLSMESVRIGVLIGGKFQINSEKMVSGVELAHEGLRDYKIQYDITMLNSAQNTYEEFASAIHQYKDYDGVILSGMSYPDYTPLINDLYRVNRNIVQVQAINEEASYLFASKHNEIVASELAAEFLGNCLKRGERKNVVLFTGNLESTLHRSAAEAFGAACRSLGLNLLESLDMKDSEAELERLVAEAFGRHSGNIDGIYITSGYSAALCRYLKEHCLDLPLVTFDTYGKIQEYMQKGVISATISQNVTNQMKTAFELLVKHIITGQVCPKTVYTDVQLVLRSNVHQYD